MKTQEAPATGPGTPGHRRSTHGRLVRVEPLARTCHFARSTPNLLSPMGRGIMRFQMQVPQQQCFNSNSAFGGATVVVKTLLSRKDLIAIYPRKTCLTADFTPCFCGCKAIFCSRVCRDQAAPAKLGENLTEGVDLAQELKT